MTVLLSLSEIFTDCWSHIAQALKGIYLPKHHEEMTESEQRQEEEEPLQSQEVSTSANALQTRLKIRYITEEDSLTSKAFNRQRNICFEAFESLQCADSPPGAKGVWGVGGPAQNT